MTEKGRYVCNRELAVGIRFERTCSENLIEINLKMHEGKLANVYVKERRNALI